MPRALIGDGSPSVRPSIGGLFALVALAVPFVGDRVEYLPDLDDLSAGGVLLVTGVAVHLPRRCAARALRLGGGHRRRDGGALPRGHRARLPGHGAEKIVAERLR